MDSEQTYDPFARYYDLDFGDHVEDIPLYREMIRRTGAPILELMCGTGRVLVPLAEDGYALTGVDVSAAMLNIARQRLAAASIAQQVTLVQADVRTVELPARHFALAFVAINSFMHLETINDQLAALKTIRHALQPDGLLILDLFNPDPFQIHQEDNRLVLVREFDLDGRHVYKFVAQESDLATQTNQVTYFYDEVDPAGQVTRRVMRFRMRWLYRYELEHVLARAGFRLRAVYGSYDLDEYTSDSPRMIAFAAPLKDRNRGV